MLDSTMTWGKVFSDWVAFSIIAMEKIKVKKYLKKYANSVLKLKKFVQFFDYLKGTRFCGFCGFSPRPGN